MPTLRVRFYLTTGYYIKTMQMQQCNKTKVENENQLYTNENKNISCEIPISVRL